MSYDLSGPASQHDQRSARITSRRTMRIRRRRLLQASCVAGLSIVALSCGDSGTSGVVRSGPAATAVVGSPTASALVAPSPVVTPRGLPSVAPSPTPISPVQPTATAGHDSAPTPTLVIERPESTGLPSPTLPIQVRIPRIKVNATVEVVGLDANGAMSPPQGFDSVAWYGLGPAPGDTGASVLAGHVDSKLGPAIFWSLRDLKLGDTIEVDLAGGATRRFVVESASWFTPEAAPLSWIFAPDGPPRLHLITCGGTFDPVVHAYDKRLVVAAQLTPANNPRSTGVTT